MQQPELGNQLIALRKELNITQEELVEKSHVSVRTIQRIEAGEVLPRMSTVRILWAALGRNYEQLTTQTTHTMETKNFTHTRRKTLLTAMIAGAIYLAVQISLSAFDIAWMMLEGDWARSLDLIYIGLTVLMLVAYVLFIRGFILLSSLFENQLLKTGCFLMIGAMIGSGILDISTLSAKDVDTLWIPYSAASVLVGALTVLFGVALIQLQDGMGELSRAAGVLEILIGCAFLTVVLFFVGYAITVPAVIVEMLLLYRGYEYLSKQEGAIA